MIDAQAVGLVAATVWIAMLSLATASLMREVAILKARIDLGSTRFSASQDGPEIGAAVPAEVTRAMPEIAEERVYLLLMSAVCASCRDLAPQLRDRALGERLIALVPGNDPNLVQSLIDMLSPTVRTIRDPQAVTLARLLSIQSTPFVVELERGLHGVSLLQR